MKPFHLQLQLAPETASLSCRWFGSSGVHEQGRSEYGLRDYADTSLFPASCLIDLQPLLSEITQDAIESAEALATVDEFLLLRDLLEPDDFTHLINKLFRFLYTFSQQPDVFEATQKTEDGRVWIDPDRRLVRVWFATDRLPIESSGRVQSFSTLQSSEELAYGVCSVFIPKSHKPGSTGTPWWQRWIRLEADDSLKLHAANTLKNDVFWARFTNKLNAWWQPSERNVFVYIHGYNVGFEDAAIRAAQIGYDLKLPGEIAFYSWPSRNSVSGYAADEATIRASVNHIARFLHELSTNTGAERIHLFVHSMGNRGFLSALERLVALRQPRLSLGQVFFCAPDEDVRIFKDKATRFPHECENRTLLVSPQDTAVFVSFRKHGDQPRVGHVPPVTVIDGIDTIAVGGFGLFDLGHGYFAQAEPVIKDMREAITTRKSAAGRTIPQASDNHYVIDVSA